jgi:hypothetical protein
MSHILLPFVWREAVLQDFAVVQRTTGQCPIDLEIHGAFYRYQYKLESVDGFFVMPFENQPV